MYDSHLNLLSPEKRRYAQHVMTMQCIKSILEVLIIVAALSGMILLGAEWVMQSYFDSLVRTMTVQTRQQGELNQQMKYVNSLLRQTEHIQQLHHPWSDTIMTLIATVPNTIVLSTLTLDAGSRRYDMSGTASTRDDILALKDILEKLPTVATVTFPLSQLTNREDVPFSLTITLK